MPIMPDLHEWLQQAGYEHYSFISWPHTDNREITDCAQYISKALVSSLCYSISKPSVFIDERITGGAKWPDQLKHALCKSVTMVAICAPLYYDTEHPWCGLEWAAMDVLNNKRIPAAEFHSIIPVLTRNDHALPDVVSQLKYIDVSGVFTTGRRYFSTKEFRQKLGQIVQRIESVAEALANKNSVAQCDQFEMPNASAFLGYSRTTRPLLFRKQK